MRFDKCLQMVILSLAFFLSSAALGADILIEELGVTMTAPAEWKYKYESSRLSTGQLMQRWVRESVVVDDSYRASPGLIAIVSEIPEDVDLAVITQQILARDPYRVKLGADTQCIKCVSFKFRTPNGIGTAISPSKPVGCSEYKLGVEADCIYQLQNYLDLDLDIEPSWANRFEKQDAPYGTSYYLVIHAIVDGKLLDLTFVYPKLVASRIEPEIASIVSSIKKKVPGLSVEQNDKPDK